MNPHWESFVEDAWWFLKSGDTTDVGVTEPPGAWSAASADFRRLFPAVDQLLKGASITAVAINGLRYQLFSWKTLEGEDCAWLSPTPSPRASVSVHPHHQVLLASFGGVVERSNEPEDTWLLNHYAVLTETLAQHDASFINHYAWAFEDAGVAIPIALTEFYSIAEEANGNTTLCHRTTGEVVLFAPDHDFDHIVPEPGCPEQTLYRIPEGRFFSSWVNAVARQWHRSVQS